MKKRAKQASESLSVAVFLALSGGLMDAYSYIGRGKVFSNAQTGNILLLGVNISERNFSRSLDYALPVLAFAFGIGLSQVIRIKLKSYKKIHWRQIVLVIETILLIYVATITSDKNYLANLLMSFACGMQVQSFRRVHDNSFSTTMCIGNLRSGVHEIVEFGYSKNIKNFENGLIYFFVILCFVIGAVLGAKFIGLIGLKAILLSPVFLIIATILMVEDREKAGNINQAG